jgi:hypothetical protein
MRAKEFTENTNSYQSPELHIGDRILKGKFKNSPAEIKGFKKDKHNQPVLKTNKGDVQLFKPRLTKLMPEGLDLYKLHSDPNSSNSNGVNFSSVKMKKGNTVYAEFNDGTPLNDDQLEIFRRENPRFGVFKWDDINHNTFEIDGVNDDDYPDFCDAYFSYAEWAVDGTPLTDEQLEKLTRDCAEELNAICL